VRDEEPAMMHHIVFWKMSKREADVEDAELAELRRRERRGELFIEFLDGERLPHVWDTDHHTWVEVTEVAAAA
jgi:hypothetical protein